MISGDAANSGFVAAGFPLLAPTPRWQVPASGGREFGMVVGNGLVIFSTIGTDVRALNWATGAAVWNRNLGAQLVGELILESIGGGQAIVVAPTSQGLLALDLQSGTIAWRSTSEGLLSAPLGGVTAGSNGALYAVTRGGWLYALNPADGRLQWSRQLTPLDEYTLPPTLAGATLLMTSRSRVVRAFDLNSLRVLWAQTLPENLVTPPCASETLGLVYVGSETGTLYTLWLNSGAIAWTAHTSSQVSGLAHDNGQIYATASDGTVSAWDGAAGALVWAVPVGDPIYSPPLTDGTQVMVTTLGGQVRYLSTATGQELGSWRISLNDPFYQGAAPAGGWLFVRGSSLYGVSP